MLKCLPGSVLVAIALWRRKKGLYDRTTLACFSRARRRSLSPRILLAYLLFRRDLGYPLQPRWTPILIQRLKRLGVRQRPLALALLAECSPNGLEHVPPSFVRKDGHRLPSLAALISRHQTADKNNWLASVEVSQGNWRRAFADYLCSKQNGGICVVGNSGRLIGDGQGSRIDDCNVVVRFNNHRSSVSRKEDIGERFDVWVGAPDFTGQVPPAIPWVIVSGPDVRYRKRSWALYQSRLEAGLPVLTVPLVVWRKLVTTTCAPPSAGILFLAWLKELLGNWNNINVIGFGQNGQKEVYHHADPESRPSPRHNWGKEQELLELWQSEELQIW
ncbi:MAG: glycosyltransferase family 29 protein [Deltaproteobacteria bacterium]|nr:glycosyltransferase family 29 protein [Deltaproteobacteria bacterium]